MVEPVFLEVSEQRVCFLVSTLFVFTGKPCWVGSTLDLVPLGHSPAVKNPFY